MRKYICEMNASGNIAVDDMILTKDAPSTAGSKMLEGYAPLYNAEVVDRLEKAGYVISGKTVVGEFGLDLVGEFSYFAEGDTLAGAAASLVAEGAVKAALNVDLNGAPRRAAAISKVDFIKPTYGTVSRYGVIACACSGEQVGVTAANVADLKEVLTAIAGHDDKDGTSLPDASYTYTIGDASGKKVCIVKELMAGIDEATKANIEAYAENLRKNGVAVEEVSVPAVGAAQAAWQILMAAETCNNLSRYDGVKYGHRTAEYDSIDELYVKSRSEGMNFLTKATILYGSDVLAKGRYTECYDKSLRIRRVVMEAMKAIFADFDAVLCPACSTTEFAPYDIADAFEKVYRESLYTAVANLTGIPAMVSGGVQLMGDHFGESVLMSLADSVERMGA